MIEEYLGVRGLGPAYKEDDIISAGESLELFDAIGDAAADGIVVLEGR